MTSIKNNSKVCFTVPLDNCAPDISFSKFVCVYGDITSQIAKFAESYNVKKNIRGADRESRLFGSLPNNFLNRASTRSKRRRAAALFIASLRPAAILPTWYTCEHTNHFLRHYIAYVKFAVELMSPTAIYTVASTVHF